jgi:hypothetical protein
MKEVVAVGSLGGWNYETSRELRAKDWVFRFWLKARAKSECLSLSCLDKRLS